jgi:hypothetical protein
MEITQEIAQKVLDTVNAGLVSGKGRPIPGKMCVETVVCFAMGLPHSTNPPCVSPTLRHLNIKLNDSNWSSKSARANGLRELALLQLGTAGVLDEKEFVKKISLLVINKYLPLMLRRINLNREADDCAQSKDLDTARDAADAAWSAAHTAATRAAFVSRAAWAAARAATDVAWHAGWNARFADSCDSCVVVYAVPSLPSDDKTLLSFAKDVAGILIDMKVPGIQWLNLIQNNSDNQKGILKYVMEWISKIIPRTVYN